MEVRTGAKVTASFRAGEELAFRYSQSSALVVRFLFPKETGKVRTKTEKITKSIAAR